MPVETTAGIIRTHAAQRGDKVAIHYGDENITFAELDRRSSQVAQGLKAAGVSNQDHIALIDKLTSRADRLWYAAKAVERGWAVILRILSY